MAPAAGAGRELLRTLARARGGWTGFEVTTLRPLAMQVALAELAREGVGVLDAFEEEALADEALDAVLASPAHELRLGELGEGTGFRRAVRGAVAALRLSGVTPGAVERAGFEDREKQFLIAAVLHGFTSRLAERDATDVAGVLVRATRALEAGAPLPAGRTLLLPGLSLRGAAGRFVRALLARGAEVLETDPVEGLGPPEGTLWRAGGAGGPLARLHAPPGGGGRGEGTEGLPLFAAAPPPSPPLSLFRAAGVHEELREVLRRVRQSGRRFEEVEIVTPDPGAYGPALHALGARLGIETTFAVGLPVERTRPGRAVAAWLRWITSDFPAAEIRRLLEGGDLVAPGHGEKDGPFLARTLRALAVGWGRERYLRLIRGALRRLEAEGPLARRHESPEQAERRHARELANLRGLERLLRPVLDAVPAVPPRMEPGSASPAQVARALRVFLERVQVESAVDRSAHERMLRVLDRIEHTLTRRSAFATAVAAVREHLAMRVPAPRAEGKAPWLSDGGALHLSDLEHGGLTGRPLVFVVGLDAGRFPGSPGQDPLLLDRERRALSPELPLTEDRLAEQQFRLAALLARLRGRVTLSWPAWEAASGRALAPSPVLLQAFRLLEGDASLGYGALEAAVGPPVSRVPRGSPATDAEDVWLAALAAGEQLSDGRAAIRRRRATLDRGLAAVEATAAPEPSARVGFLSADEVRLARLDPRSPEAPPLSASALETLGTCPLRFFYRRVLGLYPVEEPDFDPERWLPPGERGTLLHEVFQRAVLEAGQRSAGAPTGGAPEALGSPAFEALALEVLEERVAWWREALPPPSASIFEGELTGLRDDVRSFAALLSELSLAPEDVLATELALGGDEPLALPLPGGGELRLNGRIDRLDRVAGGLRVVDYKTGSFRGHGDREGVFHGGRRLQHVLYARAVEALFAGRGKPLPVLSAEYHFPTVRGQNEVQRYDRAALERGMALVAALLELPGSARFPPTDDPADCTFCDYGAVCRHGAARSDRDEPTSRRVEWSRERRAERAEAVETLRRIREFEQGGAE